MPSPFPGMNPYFEQPGIWQGFHGRFIVGLQDAITPFIVPHYVCNFEESIYIDESPDEEQHFAQADLGISQSRGHRTKAGGALVTTSPVTITLPMAIQKRHRWLTIRDTQKFKVITVIEFISPTNKAAGPDRNKYLRKRNRILESSAHLIEIDLLRGGTPIPFRDAPPSDYTIMLSRRADRPQAGLWPIHLRDPLPILPIPLRVGEPEPLIPLKPILDYVYDGGGYTYRIYNHEPTPPLAASDAEWAKAFVPSREQAIKPSL